MSTMEFNENQNREEPTFTEENMFIDKKFGGKIPNKRNPKVS